MLDAVYLKVRVGKHVVSKAKLVAYGVSEFGERAVVGVEVADGEMEDAWPGFLGGLVEQGLRGVKLVTFDAQTGLRADIRWALNGVVWQRCTVHFQRNVLSRVPKAAQGYVAAAIQTIFAQSSSELAHQALHKAVQLLRPKYPAAAAIVEEAEHDMLAYMNLPEKHWRHERILCGRLQGRLRLFLWTATSDCPQGHQR